MIVAELSEVVCVARFDVLDWTKMLSGTRPAYRLALGLATAARSRHRPDVIPVNEVRLAVYWHGVLPASHEQLAAEHPDRRRATRRPGRGLFAPALSILGRDE